MGEGEMTKEQGDRVIQEICKILGPNGEYKERVETGDGRVVMVKREFQTPLKPIRVSVTGRKSERGEFDYTFLITGGKGRQWRVERPVDHPETQRIMEVLRTFFGK